MAFDSTIRLKQLNQSELSGFIISLVQSYLSGNTGVLTGSFYPLNTNPNDYQESGVFVSQNTLDSAINQATSYVLSQIPIIETSGFLLNTGNQTLSGNLTVSGSVNSTTGYYINSTQIADNHANGYFNRFNINSGFLFLASSYTGGSMNMYQAGNSCWAMYNNNVAGGDTNYTISANGNNGYTFVARGSSNQFQLYDYQTLTNILTIDGSNNDNIGFFNDSPQYTLDVSGDGNFTSGIYINGNIVAQDSTVVHLNGFESIGGSKVFNATQYFNFPLNIDSSINAYSGITTSSSFGLQTGTQTTLDWKSRLTYDSSGNQSIDWQNRQLKAGSLVLIDWFNGIISGSWNVTSLNANSYSIGGVSGKSTTISYIKTGGATGTMTFTNGLLTSNT
jgi:hypothetical protein